MRKLTDLDLWQNDFLAFHERFAKLFKRSEPRQQAIKYVRGLMATVERKNGWHLAEVVGDQTPDSTQRLLYKACWDADKARDLLQKFTIEKFGDLNGIGVIDETGFLKKGEHSVGVQRQYSGTAGKVDNCQIGTNQTYATTEGDHLFLDRRLYLPKSWANDSERLDAAKVPQEVTFQTKPRQACDMLEHAWLQGVPMRWVTGDEVYGDAPYLRDTIARHNRYYVLAVSKNCPIWPTRPKVIKEGDKVRLADKEQKPSTVMELVSTLSDSNWKRFYVIEGEKGPRIYDWARIRVVESHQKLPTRDGWLLVRRSISDPSDCAYYLSNAEENVTIQELARVATTRYTIEQCFKEGKGEAGLDEYEVRYWHSWHRHITLSMMAHTWLAHIRKKANQKLPTDETPPSTSQPIQKAQYPLVRSLLI